jgi:hypothetical protein
MDEIARSPVPSAGLDQLPGDPFRGRMHCRPQPQNPTPVMPQNEQSVQSRNEIVGTTNRSIAAMPSAWLRRTSSIPATVAVSSVPCWPRSSARYRCRA